MKIFYDSKKSMELMRRIEDKFGAKSRKTSRGQEMHVSDLTGCQMKPYNRMIGIPRKHTKLQIGVMVFGIVAENMLGWTFPADELQYQSNIWLLDGKQNIFGHIDIYENKRYPLEVKASRKSIFKARDIPKYWIEQLASYMSMQGANDGWIVLFNVFSTQVMAFKMQMTNDDILGWLITMNMRAGKIRRAVKAKNSDDLEINPLQYNFCDYKQDCPRANECRNRWKIIEADKKRLRTEKKKAKRKKRDI